MWFYMTEYLLFFTVLFFLNPPKWRTYSVSWLVPCETADISECSVYTIQPRTMSPNVKHTNSFRSNLTHTCDGRLPRDRRRGPLTKRYVHTHRWRAWRHGRSPWLHAHSQAPGTNVTIGYTATRRLSSTNKAICHAELYKQSHLSRWALQTKPPVMQSVGSSLFSATHALAVKAIWTCQVSHENNLIFLVQGHVPIVPIFILPTG